MCTLDAIAVYVVLRRCPHGAHCLESSHEKRQSSIQLQATWVENHGDPKLQLRTKDCYDTNSNRLLRQSFTNLPQLVCNCRVESARQHALSRQDSVG